MSWFAKYAVVFVILSVIEGLVDDAVGIRHWSGLMFAHDWLSFAIILLGLRGFRLWPFEPSP